MFSKHLITLSVSLLMFFYGQENNSLSIGNQIILDEDLKSLKKNFEVKLDTPIYNPSYFPLKRRKDYLSDPYSSFKSDKRLLWGLPSDLRLDFKFSPDSNNHKYYVNYDLGNFTYRNPVLLEKDKMLLLDRKYKQKQYFNEVSPGLENEGVLGNNGINIPAIPIPKSKLADILGLSNDSISIKPTGFVNFDFGLQNQRVANPSLPIRQQRNTTFIFDPHANVTLTGKLGSLMDISATFDTKASFAFENNFKLGYTGKDYQIIQKIDFGNVSFPLTTSLIQGPQNLFGIATKLQFGRLTVSSVFANQRGTQESLNLEGGTQRRRFQIRANEYEDNRHFFISHFFRDKYESALKGLPNITSQVQITRLEVYTTNRVNNTQNLRNIVALMDLGESDKAYNPSQADIGPVVNGSPADNEGSNQLYTNIQPLLQGVSADDVSFTLDSRNLRKGEDYEILRGARKLEEREYRFNAQLGYVSLLTPLKNDEVLAVAYEYTYNGSTYKVGQLTEDYGATDDNEIVILKMIRPSSINLGLPTWDLMMKNVYSLNASQVNANNFRLRVIYRDDVTGIDNPSLQEGAKTKDVPLIQIFGLDRLNPQNDPFPDGNFDFVDGVTIDAQNGKIYFPVLEPFGSSLESQFTATEFDLKSKYVFDALYKSTKADALQAADKNKFFITGFYEGRGGTSVSLPGVNIAEGSVVVTAGGIPLVEGSQYTVDYNTGKVEIIDEAIKASGKEIKIDYEKADLFNFQTRRLVGTRFDYLVKKNFNVGGTVMNLRERPVITRVSIGEDPINNSIVGLDLNLKTPSRFLTRLVDKIPLVQTKEKSEISIYGEYAQLFPGNSPISGAVSYIDDFEGSRQTFNFGRAPHISWQLAATPQMFPQGSLSDPLSYTYKRARIAWYNVDNIFYRQGGARPNDVTDKDLENHYVRAVQPQEIFPNRAPLQIQTNELIFDVAYFPEERGMYNYNQDLNTDGTLKNPKSNWGGITRAIKTDIDFDNANVEYIDFWLMDPFIQSASGNNVIFDGKINQPNTTGGTLYLNLGSISEDIMKDGRHAFENGLPIDGATDKLTENAWGRVTNQQFLTNAFNNEREARENQDIGLDGLKNRDELSYFSDFINAVNASVTDASAKEEIVSDPSGDDFSYYLGDDKTGKKIIERYKKFNGMQGNSPVTNTTGQFTPSAKNEPDNEDLNIDNTISDVEQYYQYKIDLKPENMKIGQNHIVDAITNDVNGDQVTWYQFRIPIRTPDSKVGNINGFKSIRYMRLFLTDFAEPVVLRMAQFQLVSSRWRKFLGDLSNKGFDLPDEPYDPNFDVSVVNIEENGPPTSENVTPYVIPPGTIRDRDVTQVNNRQLNEQSMRICVQNLKDKDARAVFKNFNIDLLSYKNIEMYIHAESETARDGEVSAFLRLGTDFTDNYYEVEVPLTMTPQGTSAAQPEIIWPKANNLKVAFKDLIDTKMERNRNGSNLVIPYRKVFSVPSEGRKYTVTVVGNPDISAVQIAMIGVRNPDLSNEDDKQPKSFCVWVNELRISGFDNTPGWAALGRLNVKLADFANVTGSFNYTTFGFGAINQRISERARETTKRFDISANIALDKFFVEKLGLKLPLFVSYERENISPRFNPLDPDVPLQTYLDNIPEKSERDAYRKIVETNFTRKSINLANVKKVRMNPKSKDNFFDIENFAFSWSYSEEKMSDYFTSEFFFFNHKMGVDYNYGFKSKGIFPFKKSKSKLLKSKYFKLVKDFNFNPMPNTIQVKYELDRRFTRTIFRGADLSSTGVLPLLEKSYFFNRLYNLNWQLTKNLNLSYNANAKAIIDEILDNKRGNLTEVNQDTIVSNLKQFGRMKNFNQALNLTYKIPFDKFPVTQWINSNAKYNATYTWQAGALGIADTLGNIAQNQQQLSFITRFDLSKIYKSVPFLKKIERKPRKFNRSIPDSVFLSNKRLRIKRAVIKPFLLVRSIDVNYSLTRQTILPGFLPRPGFLGMDSTFNAPGWEFILGSQSQNIKKKALLNGWIGTGTSQNTPFMQTRKEQITIRSKLEPFKKFNINIDAKRISASNYQEIFRNTNLDLLDPVFESLNPLRSGNYSVSTITLKTAFTKSDILSKTFENFQKHRSIINARLSKRNPNRGKYSINSQDVLIPAFLAAYKGQDVNNISLSAFPQVPLPNWKISYNGLSKLKLFKKVFSSFALSHSYKSNYVIGNYTSSLEYSQKSVAKLPDRETVNPNKFNDEGDFLPVYIINQVAISENFNPLIGINAKTKNNFSFKLNYGLQRNILLNISNSQLAEKRSNNFVVGLGYTKKGLKLPIKSNGKYIVLKNDVDFRVDVTLRDSKTIQRKIEDENTITAGNFNLQIRPTINYVVNKQLNLVFYFEKNINKPRVSNSFPRTTTLGGIQLRYTIQ